MLGEKDIIAAVQSLSLARPGRARQALSRILRMRPAGSERCLYFAFEESESQVRNMLSIGIDLEQWSEEGTFEISRGPPHDYGLETHLSVMQK
jgi:KaiC/GvpD/RAD55 family RecA-like ATPase